MKPIEMLFDEIIEFAILEYCTDIHFNLKMNRLTLRRHKTTIKRIEGAWISDLYRYLKYRSNLPMRSITATQSGVFQYTVNFTLYYLRFSVLETVYQSHGVLRILNIIPINSLDACGLKTSQISQIKEMFKTNHGLILFSGKTGAGKSTTMFSALNEHNDSAIFTLENPIEQVYEQMIQIETQSDTLDQYVTQLLRHDPDILAIGELRTNFDLETVIRAALSGHLITATVHAGSIDEVLLRLQNLNFNDFDLNAILRGLVFQKVEAKEGSFHFDFEIKVFE